MRGAVCQQSFVYEHRQWATWLWLVGLCLDFPGQWLSHLGVQHVTSRTEPWAQPSVPGSGGRGWAGTPRIQRVLREQNENRSTRERA